MASISSIIGTISNVAGAAAGGNIGAAAGAAIGALTGSKSNVVGTATSTITGGGISIAQIVNARVYLNGTDLVGKAAEVSGIGAPKVKTADFDAIGMISGIKLPANLEQTEVKISWTCFYSDISEFLFTPYRVVDFQVRGFRENYGSNGLESTSQVTATFGGVITDNSSGTTIKNGEPVKLETTIAVTRAKLVIDGKEIYNYDVSTNTYKIGGQDVFSTIFPY